MAERAERAVMVADSSKLGLRCFARVGGADIFGTLITDTGMDEESQQEFTDQGLRVVAAAPSKAGR
jgi:DeoR family transcriptional regulator, aga operon transcriptional repressor